MKRTLQFLERYFTPLYNINVKGKLGEDQLILKHSNGICVVAVAPSHVMFNNNDNKIVTVEFQVTPKLNRLSNKVSGKNKRGAQWLDEASPLCHITCSDGSVYTARSCLRGKLLEVNDKLVEHPDLLQLKPCTEGYIAVVMPRKVPSRQDQQKSLPITNLTLLNQEEYTKAITDRDANRS